MGSLCRVQRIKLKPCCCLVCDTCAICWAEAVPCQRTGQRPAGHAVFQLSCRGGTCRGNSKKGSCSKLYLRWLFSEARACPLDVWENESADCHGHFVSEEASRSSSGTASFFTVCAADTDIDLDRGCRRLAMPSPGRENTSALSVFLCRFSFICVTKKQIHASQGCGSYFGLNKLNYAPALNHAFTQSRLLT